MTNIYQTANNDEAFENLLNVYGVATKKAAELREIYVALMNELGMDHAETKVAWDKYVAADEAKQPLAVSIGQMAMRRQIDSMSKSEYESFRSLID